MLLAPSGRSKADMVTARDVVLVRPDPVSRPVEWRISKALVAYEAALAAMEARAAAIAIRIRRWVTMHGVALNIDCDLLHYAGIVPCGVSEPRYGVTSLADLGIKTTPDGVDAVLRREFEQLFGAAAGG